MSLILFLPSYESRFAIHDYPYPAYGGQSASLPR
jgi:hypothetical protein